MIILDSRVDEKIRGDKILNFNQLSPALNHSCFYVSHQYQLIEKLLPLRTIKIQLINVKKSFYSHSFYLSLLFL